MSDRPTIGYEVPDEELKKHGEDAALGILLYAREVGAKEVSTDYNYTTQCQHIVFRKCASLPPDWESRRFDDIIQMGCDCRMATRIAQADLDRLAELNVKETLGRLDDAEKAEQERLRAQFPELPAAKPLAPE